MRILNLYCGLGGNRRLWGDEHEITAVEQQKNIAETYHKLYPNDHIVIGDAHGYLLKNHQSFDFIWSSPPCYSHSIFTRSGRNRSPRYPDMSLYQEIILLEQNFDGFWVVENVRPYYQPLKPAQQVGRHLFWSNFPIDPFNVSSLDENMMYIGTLEGAEKLKAHYGIHYEGVIYCGDNHDPCQALRNCVEPELGKWVLDCAMGIQTIADQNDLFSEI